MRRAIVVDQWREPSANPDVDAHARIGRIGEVHVVALVVGDHLQRELVVIAQKKAPLAVVRDGRRLRHDVGDGQPIFLPERHVNARHQREVKRHVALIALAKVGADVGRPLVRFRKNETVRVIGVDCGANSFDHGMRLGQVFAGGSIPLAQIGNRVHAQRVHAHIEPESHRLQDFFENQGIIEIEVGLVRKKTVPVEGLCGFVPRPVRLFGVGEDNACVLVELVGIRPDVHVALRRAGRRKARSLEPRMLIAGVINDQLDHDLHVALMGGVEKGSEVSQGAVRGIDVDVVRDVVTVISKRRRKERKKPDAGDAELLEIVQMRQEAWKVADAIAVRVGEGTHVQFVDDGVLEPQRIDCACQLLHASIPQAGWMRAFILCIRNRRCLDYFQLAFDNKAASRNRQRVFRAVASVLSSEGPRGFRASEL